MGRHLGLLQWDAWLDEGLAILKEANLLRSLRPLNPRPWSHESVSQAFTEIPGNVGSGGESFSPCPTSEGHAMPCRVAGELSGMPGESKSPPRQPPGPKTMSSDLNAELLSYEGPGPWDRSAVEVEVPDGTFQAWLEDRVSTGDEADLATPASSREARDGADDNAKVLPEKAHPLVLFSGNDYLGLASHPAVRLAAAQAAERFGMGPRSSPLVCGYSWQHRALESALARLKGSQECLLTPTGFAANLAVLTAVGRAIPGRANKSAQSQLEIFSDELNHASIIDGLRLAQRLGRVAVQIFRHNDMVHLDSLLSASTAQLKLVVTESLFSMDGDFAPMVALAALRQRHGFLWLLDEAHATLVCGEHGGGAAEAFHVADHVDIHVGTLSKAIGCQGGFVACSSRWKQWILSSGRAFIFSTALPIPVVAAASAAIRVAACERWRQHAVWARVHQLSEALGCQLSSPIAPIIVGGASEALQASRELLKAGFHVPAIRPPTVRPNSSRLRVTLSASHSSADVAALIQALPESVKQRVRTNVTSGDNCGEIPAGNSPPAGLAENLSYGRDQEAGVARMVSSAFGRSKM